MKKCPKCGCTEFTASQVQKHRVIVNGNGKFIRNNELYSEDPIMGPYVCCSCGAEYQQLDDLSYEAEYDRFTYSGRTESDGVTFGVPILDKRFTEMIQDLFRNMGMENGYYTYSATSIDGKKTRSGVVRVSEDVSRNRNISVAEEWLDGYDRISMPAAATYLNDYLNATRIECKDGLLWNMYVVRAKECDYVFNEYPKARIIDNTMDIGVQIEIETLDPFVTYKCIINSSLAYEDLIIRYRCCDPDSYDPDARILYSSCEMYETYRRKVDKHEYPNYDCWLADMLKSGVFVKL